MGDYLFELALQENWEGLATRLKEVTSSDTLMEPSTLLETFGPDEPLTQQSSLLHASVCLPTVPVSIVETILQKAPSLALSRDTFGRTPLHVAVCHAPRADVVRTLVREAAHSALQQDDTLMRPIDNLSQSILMSEERSKYYDRHYHEHSNQKTTSQHLWDCVQPLAVALDPSGDYDWESPMVHACLRANNFPYALLERAMKRYGDDFGKADQQGNHPLHIVAGIYSPDDDPEEQFLTSIANRYPKAARITNQQGKLALDLAIQAGLRGWSTGLAELLELYPAPENFSMPVSTHLLGLASSQGRTTMLFEMLRNQPEFFSYRSGRSGDKMKPG
ncbi:expressed unknown protein [Seminavis robusta]|uniref:Uncharacterized protein n=1 Tax=Seminavis robusta TaxID=568900 RepID=A0A9N8D5Q8_9STRA|nr:expressed unknown protein [Seminavis robusta]|eukprot:Sro11_g008680.1 n/a (333) ;mRNA; r:120486-121484